MNENEILEQRSRLFQRMQELLDAAAKTESRSLSAEQETEFSRLETEFDKADADLKKVRNQAERSRAMSQAQVNPAMLSAINGEQRSDANAEEYRSAFNAFVRGNATQEQRSLLHKESRALSIVTGSAGGVTVPQTWATEMYRLQTVIDSIRANATVMTTDNGDQINYPFADDTSNVGEIVPENTQVTAADPVFSTKALKAYKYSSKLILVPIELLQDSAFDIEAYIRTVAAERIARIQNQHFTTGTGSGQPTGVITAATLGKTGANGQTTTITYDDIVDLIYSVSRIYRAKAKFMFSDLAIKGVRKLKDSQNRPLWEPSLQAGQVDMLLGYPVVTNDNVPVMAASAKSVLFGDFSKYVIRDVSGLGMVRLNERYADYGQVGFVEFERSDGNLLDPAAVKYYQNSAT